MKKIIVVSVLLMASIVMVTAALAQKAVTLKIGINAEITGDIPKVGEATKFAAQMYVEVHFSHASGSTGWVGEPRART